MRRFLRRSLAKVSDREQGEFASLKEKFDFLMGLGEEIPDRDLGRLSSVQEVEKYLVERKEQFEEEEKKKAIAYPSNVVFE